MLMLGGLGSLALFGGSMGAYSLIEYLLKKTGDSGRLEKVMQKRLSEEEYAKKRASGMIAETESARQDLSGVKEAAFGMSPAELRALVSLLGSGTGLSASGISSQEGGSEQTRALLDIMAGQPGFGDRVAQGSRLPMSPLVRALGRHPGGGEEARI